MRNMSFALTTEQIRNRTKTVTRRLGWLTLQPGDLVRAVVKSQGLKKGEKVEELALIRIRKVNREPLDRMLLFPSYGSKESVKEGFPGGDPWWFVAFFAKTHRCGQGDDVTRIEFEYV